MPRDAIGLDIGGANIKAATASRQALSVPFELWRHPDGLADQLIRVRERWPGIADVAVTMTGELCDCFQTKRDGVRHILAAVRQVFGPSSRVWTTGGTLANLDQVLERDPLSAAAANWLALATYVGRLAPKGPALLIDTGSTTTDIIPLLDGKPVPTGRTDSDRLRSGELVYTGIRRTPVCALLLPDVAAEWFATTGDVYVCLGVLPEEPHNCATADGRPLTRAFGHARLSRMLGGDPEFTPETDTRKLAELAFLQQRSIIVRGIQRVVDRLPNWPVTAILVGSGEFLAQHAWEDYAAERSASADVLSLANSADPVLSESACAYALAVLATEAVACN